MRIGLGAVLLMDIQNLDAKEPDPVGGQPRDEYMLINLDFNILLSIIFRGILTSEPRRKQFHGQILSD